MHLRNPPSFHCHPQSLDSGSTPEAILKREQELGTGTITVTDHGSLACCRKVYDLARSKGVTPILGVEGYFRDDECPILMAKGVDPAKHLKYYHITIHALDQDAYYKIVSKVSRARTERHGSEVKPLFTWADLEEIGSMNVTVGSGCLVGMVQRHLLAHGDMATAEAYYLRLRSLVRPGNFYAEVFPHSCTHNWVQGVFVTLADGTDLRFYDQKNLRLGSGLQIKATELAKAFAHKGWKGDTLVGVMDRRVWRDLEPKAIVNVRQVEDFIENECLPWTTNPNVQQACNEVILGFAAKYGDPVVISDDSHYAHEEDKIVQDIRLQQQGNWRFYGTYARQSAADSWAYFKANGVTEAQFEGWVDNNISWGQRFKDFKLIESPSLPTKFYPQDTLKHTVKLVRMHGRMQWKDQKYLDRLKAEIDLLHYNKTIDLLPYFFVGEDVCSAYSKKGQLTGPGRGSAAGLLLTYLLGITHVDPIRYRLSMERFLTLDRIKSGKLPDIDFDFPSRDLLVEDRRIDKLEVTLEDGSVIQVTPDHTVLTAHGPIEAIKALESGFDVVDWRLE
jgi:DNA polymerase III alpha subunit